jgi:hypothetical protein
MGIVRVVVTALVCALMLGGQARLSPRFRTVFIMEMSNALDQHLASRLANAGVLWVVLDPASADAVLTDSIDGGFWTWMQRTYPPPNGGTSAAEETKTPSVTRDNPGSHHRGTVFLVDPRKRVVLWSTYELPKDASPSELDRAAGRITNQLKAAYARK